jgi:hypothetical protein
MDDDVGLRESLESANERARSAEERARLLELRLEVERCARQAGIVDTDAAFRLLDASRAERNEAGDLVNVGALVGELAQARPWLLGATTTTDERTASPANAPRDGSRRLTRDDLRRMTPEQINANWEAIQTALREDR